MTEKDAIKCFHFAQANWWYLPIHVNISKIESNRILNEVTQLINK